MLFDLAVKGASRKLTTLNKYLGSQWNNLCQLQADAKVNVATNVDLALQFGVGLSKATGVDPFFSLSKFSLNSAIAGNGSTLDSRSEMGRLVVRSPRRNSRHRAAGAAIAIANSELPMKDRVSVTPSGSLDLDFAFNAQPLWLESRCRVHRRCPASKWSMQIC